MLNFDHCWQTLDVAGAVPVWQTSGCLALLAPDVAE
jgi:hypothetical protein